MAKSKFFGYVLRNAGTPCQQLDLDNIELILPDSVEGIIKDASY